MTQGTQGSERWEDEEEDSEKFRTKPLRARTERTSAARFGEAHLNKSNERTKVRGAN